MVDLMALAQERRRGDPFLRDIEACLVTDPREKAIVVMATAADLLDALVSIHPELASVPGVATTYADLVGAAADLEATVMPPEWRARKSKTTT